MVAHDRTRLIDHLSLLLGLSAPARSFSVWSSGFRLQPGRRFVKDKLKPALRTRLPPFTIHLFCIRLLSPRFLEHHSPSSSQFSVLTSRLPPPRQSQFGHCCRPGVPTRRRTNLADRGRSAYRMNVPAVGRVWSAVPADVLLVSGGPLTYFPARSFQFFALHSLARRRVTSRLPLPRQS